MAADRRYWDSNAFLGYLNDEKDKAPQCEGDEERADELTFMRAQESSMRQFWKETADDGL